MDIRFLARAKAGQSGYDGVPDHARRGLQFRLGHGSVRVAHVLVRIGDTGSRRGRLDTYGVMRVPWRGAPAATVVDIDADGRRPPPSRTEEMTA